jgi:hypothetical protein
MAQPSPPSVLSGALKIADKVTVSMEAVGNKIRLNSQGWEDARMICDRQIAIVSSISWPSTGRQSSRTSTHRACTRRGRAGRLRMSNA